MINFKKDELMDLRCSVIEAKLHEETWLRSLETDDFKGDPNTERLIKHSQDKIKRLNMLLKKF